MGNVVCNTESRKVFDFHGQELLLIGNNGEAMVAMRPVVEGMGLNWKTQYRKLTNQLTKYNCGHMTTVALDGKIREMLCMPIRKINLWLASITPSRIKNLEVREKVELYQEECAQALYSYWHFGIAVKPEISNDVTAMAYAIVEYDLRNKDLQAQNTVLEYFKPKSPPGTISPANGNIRLRVRRGSFYALKGDNAKAPRLPSPFLQMSLFEGD